VRNCANADVNMEKRPSDRLRLRLRHSMQGSTRTSYDRRVDDELMKFNIEDVISYVLNNLWIRLFASDREWLKKAHEISRCRKYFRFAVCKIRAFVHCFQPKNIKDFSIHNIKFGKKSTAKHSVNSNKIPRTETKPLNCMYYCTEKDGPENNTHVSGYNSEKKVGW